MQAQNQKQQTGTIPYFWQQLIKIYRNSYQMISSTENEVNLISCNFGSSSQPINTTNNNNNSNSNNNNNNNNIYRNRQRQRQDNTQDRDKDKDRNKNKNVVSLKKRQNCFIVQVYALGRIGCKNGSTSMGITGNVSTNGTANLVGNSNIDASYMHVVEKINASLCKDDLVFWVEQNCNFGIRRIIQCSWFGQASTYEIKSYLTNTKKILQQVLSKCISQLLEPPQYQKQRLSINKSVKYTIAKKISMLQLLKYQFQLNRKKRPKTTQHDFNYYKIKTIEELILLREACGKEGKNFIMALRENFVRSQVNAVEALQYYKKIQEVFSKKQNDTTLKDITQDNNRILHPFQILQEKQVTQRGSGCKGKGGSEASDAMKGSSSSGNAKSSQSQSGNVGSNSVQRSNQKVLQRMPHIQQLQIRYKLIFSMKVGTNLHFNRFAERERIQRERGEKTGQLQGKEVVDILIRKRKCFGCGQSEQKVKDNQIVFENQKFMLLILNQLSHGNICGYFVKEFKNRQEINQVYCKRMPHDPIKIFFDNRRIINPTKYIKNSLKFLLQVTEGLNFLYDHKIIHRDLKPMNIMLSKNFQAKIIDFGSSCTNINSKDKLPPDFSLTLRSTTGYYLPYIDQLAYEIKLKYSQNQYERHPCFDVYSLGCIMEKLFMRIPKLHGEFSAALEGNFEYLVKKCKDMHPDDRLLPLQAGLFLCELYQIFNQLSKIT